MVRSMRCSITKSRTCSRLRARRAITLLVAIGFLVLGGSAAARYLSGNGAFYDIGVMDNLFWQTLHGRLFYYPQYGMSYFGDHFTPKVNGKFAISEHPSAEQFLRFGVGRGYRVPNLKERTFIFAKNIRLWIKTISNTLANLEDAKQLVRSSGLVGANYLEANEALSKKDFLMRVKISRKEAKESIYWFRLIYETNDYKDESKIIGLIQEATELKNILSAIIEKSQ